MNLIHRTVYFSICLILLLSACTLRLNQDSPVYRPVIEETSQQQIDSMVRSTLSAMTLTAAAPVSSNEPVTTPSATPSPLPALSPTPTASHTPIPASATPLPTPLPLPDRIRLEGFVHLYQNLNNCGPATLAMDLSYWGWPSDLGNYVREKRQRDLQTLVASILKPVPEDKNVSPQEMAVFVNEHTPLKALVRVGGDLNLIQQLVAARFPVMIEKGIQTERTHGWVGHHQLITGFQAKKETLWVYDSFLGPSTDFEIPNVEMVQDWRAFNFVYLVVYPPEREADLYSILGSNSDPEAALLRSAQIAQDEVASLDGRDRYFAWVNLGSSWAGLGRFAEAVHAFDQAAALYPELPSNNRPWRLFWYNTYPYQAYYETGRYSELVQLVSATLEMAFEPQVSNGPFLEENFYWRGRGYLALGQTEAARADFEKAVELNPTFIPALEELEHLGTADLDEE